MKKLLRIPCSIISILLLLYACTKEIGLSTEVEFELTEQHTEEGYVNQMLPTTVTVIPEAELEGFDYSFAYSVSHGNGHFEDNEGNVLPSGENISLNPLSASVVYRGVEKGEHTVSIRAKDSYGFYKELELNYTIIDVPVTWTATSPVSQIELGTSAAITITLTTNDDGADTTYERHYSIATGTGNLYWQANGTTVSMDTYETIAPATYQLSFTPDALGSMALSFTLLDSNGQELKRTLNFEVVEDIVDTTPPVITLLGPNPMQLILGNTYNEPGAEASDDIDGDISDQISSDASAVDTTTEGSYEVTYAVEDSDGNQAAAVRTVNVIQDSNDNQPPVAFDDFISTGINNGMSILVLNNDDDFENDALTITLLGTVTPSGSATIEITGGFAVSFQPATNYEGAVNFTYTINDGTPGNDATATVTVTVGDDAIPATSLTVTPTNINMVVGSTQQMTAVFVPSNTTNQNVTWSSSNTATATVNANGLVSAVTEGDVNIMATSVENGTISNFAAITVTAPSNTDPIAGNDAFSVAEDGILNTSVLTNDNDIDNDGLTVDLVNNSPANVGINVNGTNGGIFVIDAGGNLSFDPNNQFDTLNDGESDQTLVTYRINDGNGGTATATVIVTVNGSGSANTAPVAQNDIFTVAENGALNGNILNNNGNGDDSDAEGNTLTVDLVNGLAITVGQSVNSGTGGVFTINSDGNLSFDPDGDFDALNDGESAQTTMTYRITDGADTSNTATITVTVTGSGTPNSAPVAQTDLFTVVENGVLNEDLFADNGNGPDSDPDVGDNLTVSHVNGSTTLVGQTVNGSNGGQITITSTGALNFFQEGDFDDLNNGESRFTSATYQITDGSDFSNTATVTIRVTGVGTPTPDITFNPITGRYTAPPGTTVVVDLTGSGAGKGHMRLEGHTQSNRQGQSLFTAITQSWNNDGSQAVLFVDSASFNMPANGEMYFYGRHTVIIGTVSDSSSNITFDNASGNENFTMDGNNQIQ